MPSESIARERNGENRPTLKVVLLGGGRGALRRARSEDRPSHSSRERGWTRYPLAANVVDPDWAIRLPDRQTADWAIDVTAGTVRLVDPPPVLAALALPLEPMIGCFGVAPGNGEAISTSTPGPHGGNMDWRGFRPGAIVWFPVSVPGALLFAGDGHAGRGTARSAAPVSRCRWRWAAARSAPALADPLAARHHR